LYILALLYSLNKASEFLREAKRLKIAIEYSIENNFYVDLLNF